MSEIRDRATGEPGPEALDDDVEAQGLKETIAVALGAGALALPTTAAAYPTPEDPGARLPAAAATQAERPDRSPTVAKNRKGKKATKSAAAKRSAPDWKGERSPGQQPQ